MRCISFGAPIHICNRHAGAIGRWLVLSKSSGWITMLTCSGPTLSCCPAEHIVELLQSILFEFAYERTGYFHLYNVDLPDGPISLPTIDTSVVSLSANGIPRILNETTQVSRLVYEGTGNAFVKIDDRTPSSDDWEW